jgi:hypothetical protein
MSGVKILVYAPSGHGKSSAGRNLDPKTTGYINNDRKDLPFYGWRTNYVKVVKPDGTIDWKKTNYIEPKKTSSVQEAIEAWEKIPHIETIVIDTITHMMAHDFMRRVLEKGYDKFSQMGKAVYDLLDYIRSTKSDKNFVVLAHNELSIDAAGDKVNKIRSFGKLMDEKVEIPSMFTSVLYATVKRDGGKASYVFITQSDGTTFAKSPAAFKGEQVINALPYEMPNDTALVIQRLKAFQEGKLEEMTEEAS